MTCPVCRDIGMVLGPCFNCGRRGPQVDPRLLRDKTDDAIRRICLGLNVPPAVIGYGWLAPDPNPMPRFGWWSRR